MSIIDHPKPLKRNPFLSAAEPTLADVLDCLERDDKLSPTRRRDQCSALRRLAQLLNRDPAMLPARISALRHGINNIHPVHAGVSVKTLQNIKSNVLGAFRHLEISQDPQTMRLRLSTNWQRLFRILPEKNMRYGLSRFMHFCSAAGYEPGDVNDPIVDEFVVALNEATFVKNPDKVHRQTVRLWNIASGRLMLELTGHDERILSVAVSSDGTRIATASLDKTVRLWDTSSGATLLTLSGVDWPAVFVTFSPDGHLLASSHGDQAVRLWDAASGELLATLSGHDHEVSAIAFSPDGDRMATSSRDRTLRVWDVSKRRTLATFLGHEDEVTSIAFSPDGTRIASGSLDSSVRLWDASSGELMATLTGHDGYRSLRPPVAP